MAEPALAVLFDLDATLLDLPVAIEPVRAAIAASFAARGHADTFRPLLPAIEAAAAASAGSAAERDRLRRDAHALIAAAEVEAAARATARPGAAALVAALDARRLPLGIVTDNGAACVRLALRAAGISAEPWRVIVARDHVRAGKPDPDGVVQAARRLLPGGGRLVFAGDSARDLGAGHAARALLPDHTLTLVGVAGGRSPREDLVAAAPDHLLDEVGALLSLLPRAG